MRTYLMKTRQSRPDRMKRQSHLNRGLKRLLRKDRTKRRQKRLPIPHLHRKELKGRQQKRLPRTHPNRKELKGKTRNSSPLTNTLTPLPP